VELEFKNSFFRDLDNIGSREPRKVVERLIFRINRASSISEVQGAKILRNHTHTYKIEFHVQSKTYWITCNVLKDKVMFLRIKSETWFKKNI